jgi:hypothetical protein
MKDDGEQVMLQNDDDSRLTPGLSLLIMKITTNKDAQPGETQ